VARPVTVTFCLQDVRALCEGSDAGKLQIQAVVDALQDEVRVLRIKNAELSSLINETESNTAAVKALEKELHTAKQDRDEWEGVSEAMTKRLASLEEDMKRKEEEIGRKEAGTLTLTLTLTLIGGDWKEGGRRRGGHGDVCSAPRTEGRLAASG